MSSQFCQLVQCVEEQLHGSLGIGVFHIMPVHSEQYQRRTLFIKGTLGKGEKGRGCLHVATHNWVGGLCAGVGYAQVWVGLCLSVGRRVMCRCGWVGYVQVWVGKCGWVGYVQVWVGYVRVWVGGLCAGVDGWVMCRCG